METEPNNAVSHRPAESCEEEHDAITPYGATSSATMKSHRKAFATLKLVALSFILATALAWSWLAYVAGSLPASIAYLRGDHLFVPKSVRVNGDGKAGASIDLMNLTNKPISIIGYKLSCPCVAISGVPLTIGPRENKEVPVAAASLLDRDVEVLFSTDAPGQDHVPLVVEIIAQKS